MSYERGTFARFFRAVEGRIMSRYGTETATKHGYRAATVFGGRRPSMTPKQIKDAQVQPLRARPTNPMIIDTEAITPITHGEARKYKREYDRAVRVGDLVECTEEQYVQWCAVRDARDAKGREKAEAIKAERTKASEFAEAAAKRLVKARQDKLRAEAEKAGYAPNKAGEDAADGSGQNPGSTG